MSTVNVNLTLCDCTGNDWKPRPLGSTHADDCSGVPLLIPCPIPPSVTFQVALGECLKACTANTSGRGWVLGPRSDTSHFAPGHVYGCPGRPVRVSCSISGRTWEASEVMPYIERPGSAVVTWGSKAEQALALGLCRSRWSLVKALVLGMPHHSFIDLMTGPMALDLLAERDAVFAALAKMARAEEAAAASQRAVIDSFPAVRLRSPTHLEPLHERPSADLLESYVEHLIEQVGNLNTNGGK